MSVASGFLEQIEYARALELVAPFVRTPMGRGRLESRLPLADREGIELEQAKVAEMRDAATSKGRLPLTEVIDPHGALNELTVAGRVLAAPIIRDVVELLVVGRDAAAALRELDPERYPQLGGLWAQFPDASSAIEAMHGMIGPTGILEDAASAELARLRQRIRDLSERLTDQLDELIRAEWTDPVLRDDYITVRNDRFVLPVRADTPRRFPGIVHGASATDKTLFVEPVQTVETNNDLVGAREDERREVERILRSYTELLRADRDAIAATAELIGRVDLLDAVACWADRTDCCRPEVGVGAELTLRSARHPVLEARLAAEEERSGAIVPVDVSLSDASRVLVISGPNAGGKTVAMKTVGLLSAMAHAGFPVPAEEASFPLFSTMMADIGDQQSVDGGLSTFSSHVERLGAMLHAAEPPALLLIDEVGTGTDPAEGAALGIAILDRLRRSGVHVVATTHHLALKTWAYSTTGAVNAAVEFDEKTIKPTYRLVPGVAGASIGLTMAEQLGLPRDVVEDARARLDPAGAEASRALEDVRGLASALEVERARLVVDRTAWERDRETARAALEAREERSRRSWHERLERLTAEFRREAARLLRELESARDRKKLEERARSEEAAVRRRMVADAGLDERLSEAPAGWRPMPGGPVRVASLSRDGVLRRIDGESAQVELGRSLFTVTVQDLRPPGADASEPADRSPTGRTPLRRNESERSGLDEIVLIGNRVDEARDRLEKFLDEALMSGVAAVRIVHGRGTGRLRDAVHELLREHPAVGVFELADEAEGGVAVTVARIDEG